MSRRVEKPWGHEIIFAENDRYAGKILCVRAGEKLSLQYHEKKDETIYLLSGQLDLQIEENGELSLRRLQPGESCHIPPRAKHRMIAITDCEIAEASSPELDDVVRIEDSYGRASGSKEKISRVL